MIVNFNCGSYVVGYDECSLQCEFWDLNLLSRENYQIEITVNSY